MNALNAPSISPLKPLISIRQIIHSGTQRVLDISFYQFALTLTLDRQYRRNLLRSLNRDLRADLVFTEQMALENPKNYQVW